MSTSSSNVFMPLRRQARERIRWSGVRNASQQSSILQFLLPECVERVRSGGRRHEGFSQFTRHCFGVFDRFQVVLWNVSSPAAHYEYATSAPTALTKHIICVSRLRRQPPRQSKQLPFLLCTCLRTLVHRDMLHANRGGQHIKCQITEWNERQYTIPRHGQESVVTEASSGECRECDVHRRRVS